MKFFSKKIAAEDYVIMVVLLTITSILCRVLSEISGSDNHVPLLFVLCVLLISRFSTGYLCGLIAALLSVVFVNYVFTYPYMELNFTISGYPVTFLTMLTVAFTTSTLTSHMKHQEEVKLEIQREKMRANLLRAISHDLRTPLTSISGSVSAVLDDPEMDAKKRTELLSDVQKDSQWLIRMVENLLSVTRINDGTASIRKQEELAEEITAEVIAKFHKRFPHIHTSVNVPEEAFFVPMDAMLIEQVLFNIMENAVLHGGSTQSIQIEVKKQEDAALFTITNDGEAISREALSHLFVDYFDMAQKSAVEAGGEKRNMGIGLSVCHSIIKAHGGNMQAHNLPDGQGVYFSFTLPLS